VDVYFPGDTVWYDHWTHERLEVKGVRNIAAPYDKVPVFQRGGSIIPVKERIRRSAALMHEDPVTLVVAPDREGKASGTLYLDDGKSFEYRDGARIYVEFTYDNGKLESKLLSSSGSYKTEVWLYKVKVLGQDSRTVSTQGLATLSSGSGQNKLNTSFSHSDGVLTIRKPGVNLGEQWTIAL